MRLVTREVLVVMPDIRAVAIMIVYHSTGHCNDHCNDHITVENYSI